MAPSVMLGESKFRAFQEVSVSIYCTVRFVLIMTFIVK